MVTRDEEQDALAAEYVLGTLSGEEREHAEALRSFDPGFAAAVLQWERRLGELNVMVEAVEPPAELWDKIKREITSSGPVDKAHERQSPALSAAAAADAAAGPDSDEAAMEALPEESAAPMVPAAGAAKIERSADVIYLARRVRRWRGLTLAFGAIAALLALYLAAWQVAPDLIPPQLKLRGMGMVAQSQAPSPGRMQQDRLVAVLQHEPTGPAFLLTLDTQRRTLVVRRVSATPETGKNYELWLISKRLGAPRSLGVVGAGEFTERALPGNYDVDTLRNASYAVSLEPPGGSPSGAPTGPILFTGKAVESLPSSPPPATPKT